MILKIKVKDTIRVYDSVEDLKKEVNRVIDEYVLSDDNIPLIITITKIEDRAPPVLGVHVKDNLDISETLGG